MREKVKEGVGDKWAEEEERKKETGWLHRKPHSFGRKERKTSAITVVARFVFLLLFLLLRSCIQKRPSSNFAREATLQEKQQQPGEMGFIARLGKKKEALMFWENRERGVLAVFFGMNLLLALSDESVVMEKNGAGLTRKELFCCEDKL